MDNQFASTYDYADNHLVCHNGSDEDDAVTTAAPEDSVQASILKSLMDALDRLEETIEEELQKILARYDELEKRVNRLNAIELMIKGTP